MIVAVINLKGGTAKTTTALALATAATRAGMAARVWDADPQGTASEWAAYAEGQGGLGFEVLPANVATVRRMADPGPGAVEIVDCPPSGSVTDAAADRASFVVVPTGTGNADLSKTLATAATLAGNGKPHAALVCNARKRTLAEASALETLEAEGVERFAAVIYEREDLRASFGQPFGRELHGYAEVLGEIMGRTQDGEQ